MKDKAARAAVALKAYAKAADWNNPNEVLNDLLSDLMHWCDQHKRDFDYAVEVARANYQDELEQDAEENETEIVKVFCPACGFANEVTIELIEDYECVESCGRCQKHFTVYASKDGLWRVNQENVVS